jgi:hypothetical protein
MLKDDLAKLLFGNSKEEIPGQCIKCKKPFDDTNVFTKAGWKETELSGFCEKCFDDMFKED